MTTSSAANQKPYALPVWPEYIPSELKERDQWVLWKYQLRHGKWTKPPLQTNGKNAKSTDPSTWTTFEAALNAYDTNAFNGIGFVLTEEDPYVGVDMDHCVEAQESEEWANEIMDDLDSYTEFSPSDTGVRVIVRGRLPAGRRKKGDLEMYETDRYLTITGNEFGEPRDIEERTSELAAVHRKWLEEEPQPNEAKTTSVGWVSMSDAEVLERAFNAKNGTRFQACYSGDNTHTKDGSPSAGDLSLVQMLAFWTQDPDQIDRMFRGSPRMRPKWDSARGDSTYGRDTIETALSGIRESYEPAIPAKLLLSASRPHPGDQAARLEEARRVFGKWLYLPNDDHVVAALGAVAANLLDGDPLWVLFVGPPGSGKTEAVQPLTGLPYVHPAATLTEPALLSGVPKKSYEKGATGGLLREIGDFGIILTKDFSGVLSMHRDARAAVLAALREIFDGSWARPVGTGGGRVLQWEGKAGFIGAVTPSIDRHTAVMGALGERFILYRLDDTDSNAKADKALTHFGNQKVMRKELSEAAQAALENIGRYPAQPLTNSDTDRLVRIAQFAVKARTTVERDGYRRTVQTIPEHEHATRLALQLAQLRAGILEIGADDETAWRIVAKCGFDSIPRLRWLILTALRAADDWQTNADLTESTGIPRKTLEEHAEDLDLLGLVDREKASKAANASWMQQLAAGVADSWPE